MGAAAQAVTDVAIVGAGINGSAIAYSLLQKRTGKVLIIDRAGVASGQTGASSAVIRQHYGHETTARMALDSLRFFQRFDEVTGGHAEFKTCGMLGIGGADNVATMRRVVEMQRRIGIRTEMISVDRIRELEPDMETEGVAGGCWEPDAGYADPVGTTAGLLRWAIEHGGTAWLDTNVDRVVVESGRVVGLETSRGRVSADVVVLAAGPWIGRLATGVGTTLPIRSSRHPVLVFKHPSRVRPSHIVFDLVQIMYLRPEAADLTLVGTLDIAHSEEDANPDDFEREPTFDEVSRWGQMLMTRFPRSTDAQAMRGWCGIYEYTPDWHHVIDELPGATGCFVVCGTSGHGFKLGPAVGDIMSDLVLGMAPAYDIRDFRLNRFELGRAIRNEYSATIVG